MSAATRRRQRRGIVCASPLSLLAGYSNVAAGRLGSCVSTRGVTRERGAVREGGGPLPRGGEPALSRCSLGIALASSRVVYKSWPARTDAGGNRARFARQAWGVSGGSTRADSYFLTAEILRLSQAKRRPRTSRPGNPYCVTSYARKISDFRGIDSGLKLI